MSISTLRPSSTIANGSSSIGGGAGSRHAALNDDSDTTYVDVTGGSFFSPFSVGFTDPGLDGHKVADIVGISVRYANAILAEQDLSLHRLILSRRLSHCRVALEDPNQMHRTIAEIAHGWGFSDMTHFGRCFKAAYGASPREYQKAAAQSGRGGRL